MKTLLTHLNPQPVPPPRVVILGAGGFVGSAFIQCLQQANIAYLPIYRNELDLADDNNIKKLSGLLNEKDILIQLATHLSGNAMTTADFIINLQIIKNTCAAIATQPCQQVIYFSSDAVYSPTAAYVSETTLASPNNLYGAMHLARELALQTTLHTLAIPYTIVRPTQIYGMDARHNAYGPCRMYRSALHQKHIQLFGQGEELRDFIAIDDVVKLLLFILYYKSVGTINFATGYSISFAELANKIRTLLHFPIEINSLPRTQTIWHRQFDITNLKNAFPNFCFSTLENNLANFCH